MQKLMRSKSVIIIQSAKICANKQYVIKDGKCEHFILGTTQFAWRIGRGYSQRRTLHEVVEIGMAG